MPVLVVSFLSPSVNARFYTALLLVSFAYIVPAHLSTALFGVSTRNHALLSRELQRIVTISASSASHRWWCSDSWTLLLAMFEPQYSERAPSRS